MLRAGLRCEYLVLEEIDAVPPSALPEYASAPDHGAVGDLEASMARKAGSGSVLSEPQVGAWYAVSDGRVRPLNAEARKVVGSGTTLQAYQQIVHGRYADKLPGSRYDDEGFAGGFDESAATEVEPGGGPSAQTAALGLGGAGALAAAGAITVRRRYAQR